MREGATMIVPRAGETDLYVISLGRNASHIEGVNQVLALLERIAAESGADSDVHSWIILDMTGARHPDPFLFGLLAYANSGEFTNALERVSVCTNDRETIEMMKESGLINNGRGRVKLFGRVNEAYNEFKTLNAA